ncbi:MAG: hypothetical protein K2P51_03220 [Rhabdochlamydiaceae bacterium]|nr:hypothetical protein [Rhabdochlamydiaceae bacterium]
MPTLHIANTFFEHELSNETSASLTQTIDSHPIHLQLQFLPFLYADEGDYVGVTALPAHGYLSVLKQWKLPQLNTQLLHDPKIPHFSHLNTWGASHLIKQWAARHHLPYDIPAWHLVKEIQSKSFCFQNTPQLKNSALLRTEEDTKNWLSSCPGPKVLKTCFGLSGRGHLIIDDTTKIETIFQFTAREFKQARPVIAQPWVERILDFSTQWEIAKDQTITFIGTTLCINDAKGKYIASCIADEPTLFGEFLPFLEEHKERAQTLLCALAKLSFFGNIGFDAMIYKEKNSPHLHPIVEINARKTMAWAGMMFQRKHAPEEKLTFRFCKGTQGLLPTALLLQNGKCVEFTHNLAVSISSS